MATGKTSTCFDKGFQGRLLGDKQNFKKKKGIVNNPVVPINDNTTEATKAQDQAHEDCRRREKNTPGWLADIDLGQTEKGHVIV
jgi:hypothetical protein